MKKHKTLMYLAKIDSTMSQATINHLLQLISSKNREKCQRFRYRADVLRTLYGELMIRCDI